MSKTRDQFDLELRLLEQRFEALAPELELTVRDPELDVEGFVVVWSTLAATGGPLGRVGKGGTRITPGVTLDEIKMLSRVMTLKNAAAGLPLGGAKSGLRADPSAPDFEKRYRRFVSLVRPVLAENGGSFGGFGFDIGGQQVHALWACDELGSTRSFTGKPVEMGGTDYDREGIAGFGVVVAARSLFERRGESIAGRTFAVQGLGAMGGAVVRYLSECGGQLVAFADPRVGGTYILENGASELLVKALSRQDFESACAELSRMGTQRLSIDDVLYAPVDLLFPAAVQNVIDVSNVSRIRARAVIEAANGPVTAEARTKLFELGIELIPDFIANPGGIIAAFVEMTAGDGVDKVGPAKETTQQKIRENVLSMFRLVDELTIEPAAAGMYLALRNIFERKD